MSLFITKPVSSLMAEANASDNTLKRTLGPMNLVALGIGAIIGAGLFVRTAAAAAQNAGPSVTIGFIVASVGCAFAGLCYAEFASMIPIAGSAYTYSYATMGEFVAWIRAQEETKFEEHLEWRNLKGEDKNEVIYKLLLHVVNHGSYHRGQVITMIKQAGGEVVSTDLLFYPGM